MQMTREISVGVAKSHFEDIKSLSSKWSDLDLLFRNPKTGPKEGNGWVPAKMPSGPRKSEFVESISLIVFDIDNKEGALQQDEIKQRINEANYRAILHSTYNHTRESPRYRLIIDISEQIQPANHKNFLLDIARHLDIFDYIDKACLDVSRFYYRPRYSEERSNAFEFWSTDGNPVDVKFWLDQPRSHTNAISANIPAAIPATEWAENDSNIAKIREFLNYCPADCDYDQWRNIVWSICSLNWNIGPKLIREWSCRSARHWGDS
jgi:hypothetical protein